jgi:hypothetical protein
MWRQHESSNHRPDTNSQAHQNEHQNRKIIFEHVIPETHAAVMPRGGESRLSGNLRQGDKKQKTH